MDKTVLFSMPLQDFQAIIVDCVSSCLRHNPKDDNLLNKPDKLLTRDEACQLLSINKTTLWHYTKKGKLQSYGIGSRVYYKKNEVLNAIQPLKK